MANVFQNISPFEPVKILKATDVRLIYPAIENYSDFWDIYDFSSCEIPGVAFPVEPVKVINVPDFRFVYTAIEDRSDFRDIKDFSTYEIPDEAFPIESVKILNATDDLFILPIIENYSSFWNVKDFLTYEIPDEAFPIKSTVEHFSVFSPDCLIIPVLFILAFDHDISNDEFIKSLQEKDQHQGFVSCDLFPYIALHEVQSVEESFPRVQNQEAVQVSQDLLKAILPPKTVSGMLYADRYWVTEKLPEAVGKKRVKKLEALNSLRSKDIPVSKKENKQNQKPTVSIWDMIFVLLQPPLELGKNDSTFLPFPLYPYQIPGVQFLVDNHHALLADDMGTGKTVMTTVALKLLLCSNKIKSVLILCPSSVLYEWNLHLAVWAPEMIVSLVRGTADIRKIKWQTPAHVYLTTYDTLRSDVENEVIPEEKWGRFEVVVVDEAHHIKNSNTSRSKAIRKLSPTYRWALTGTPVQNKIDDMVALFDFIYPDFLFQHFLDVESVKNKIAPHFLRRRKQDVLKDLPPKIKQDVWLDMTDEQAIEYIEVENQTRIEIESMGESVTKFHIFAKMMKLKQICNFPSGHGRSPKLEALKEQVEEITSNGNKLIIFSQYVDQGVDKINDALKSYGASIIVGGQSDSTRKQEIEKFKNSDDTPILIASVSSGGEGLNLTEASYVFHFDHWWNPAVMWQAEDRAHRSGQKKSVNIYSYWMTGTIDERIYEILTQKHLLIDSVVDGLTADDIDGMITIDDLKTMLGVKKTAPIEPTVKTRNWSGVSTEQILQMLLESDPFKFEQLVAQLMPYLGLPNARVTKKTGDGGIDVESRKNTDHGPELVVAQCKRYRNPVGVEKARDFAGALADNKKITKGIMIITSTFTDGCITYCLKNKIGLVDGIRLAEYVKQFGIDI